MLLKTIQDNKKEIKKIERKNRNTKIKSCRTRLWSIILALLLNTENMQHTVNIG